MRGGKSRRHVAIAFAHDRGFGRMAGAKFAGRRVGREQFGQTLNLDRHQVGGVLGGIGVAGEHHRDRLADIAHAFGGEDRLTVRLEPFDAGEAEIDRRNSATSAAVHTATTPGAARAAAVSIATMRPWACAERTTRMCN